MIKEILSKQYNTLDFPFYKNNPEIHITGWTALFLALILSYTTYIFLYDYSILLSSIIPLLIISIPVLYYSNWNYKILLHKITKNELLLSVTMCISYIIYALIMITILNLLGLTGTVSPIKTSPIIPEAIISLLFTIMMEELIKFIPLIFFMKVFYKYSGDKKVSFIFSSIIVLTGFGLLHYTSQTTIYTALLIQGLGSIFDLYGYYKTRNLFVPYLSHLFTDICLMGLTLLPF